MPQGAEETVRRNTTAKDVRLTRIHAVQQHRWNRTDSHFCINYITLYIKPYMLNMQEHDKLKMNLYSDPIQKALVRNRRSKSKETHYTRASVAASLLDAHFLFLSSPTHTLFLWRPLKSPTRLRGRLLPHSSALLRFTRCSHPRTSSSPSSQWFLRAEVPRALGSELEEESGPCLVAWMYFIKSSDSLKLYKPRFMRFISCLDCVAITRIQDPEVLPSFISVLMLPQADVPGFDFNWPLSRSYSLFRSSLIILSKHASYFPWRPACFSGQCLLWYYGHTMLRIIAPSLINSWNSYKVEVGATHHIWPSLSITKTWAHTVTGNNENFPLTWH